MHAEEALCLELLKKHVWLSVNAGMSFLAIETLSIKVFLLLPVVAHRGALDLQTKDSAWYCPGAGTFAIYYAIKSLSFCLQENPLLKLWFYSIKDFFKYKAGPGVSSTVVIFSSLFYVPTMHRGLWSETSCVFYVW